MQPKASEQASAVCAVGIGAVTSVGLSAPTTATAVRAGVTGFGEHPFMLDRAGQRLIVARCPHLGGEIRGPDRLCALAVPAAREALAVLGDKLRNLPPVLAIVGLPPSRPGGSEQFGQAVAEALAAALRTDCPIADVEIIATGHCAGLMALEKATRTIRDGKAEFCLVGGVDSYLEPQTLEWLEECDQIHGAGIHNNAWGFIPGEAAGFCLLASPSALKEHRLQVGCEVLAVATTRENNLIKTDSVCLGQGLTEAFRQVFSALPSPLLKIDQIICDMNGEPYRADEFGFTIARTSERFVAAGQFLAPADCWGDVGAASGPLFLMLASAAAGKGHGKGPLTLGWTSSESGERSAVLIKADNQKREPS
jgi:3-oxoacyl-[acyl-carrier-protein] synthase-1